MNIVSSKMSFEFNGAFIAMNVLREYGAVQDLVDQVGEVVIRHQDVGTTGTQTAVGALIHVTTLLGKLCALSEVDGWMLTIGRRQRRSTSRARSQGHHRVCGQASPSRQVDILLCQHDTQGVSA